MPIQFIPFIYVSIFLAILVLVVPKSEIRRLSIYGIIFGAVFDVILVTIANLIGAFRYINYEPYGLFGIHFFAPISWAIFFILYFYFLPNYRPYLYIYVVSAIFYGMLFCQMITKLAVLKLSHGLYDSTIPFIIWFPIATWGYLKLTQKDGGKSRE